MTWCRSLAACRQPRRAHDHSVFFLSLEGTSLKTRSCALETCSNLQASHIEDLALHGCFALGTLHADMLE